VAARQYSPCASGCTSPLLHEAHDEILSDEPLLCPQCGHVVPDMAFCVACWRSDASIVTIIAAGATGNPTRADRLRIGAKGKKQQ